MFFIWLFGFLAILMLGCLAWERPSENEIRKFFFLDDEVTTDKENENKN